MKLLIAALGVSLGMTVSSSFAEIRFASGPERTSLLELFTSEGCSSCPPAEAQFSRLTNNPGLWKQFVPVAWHVDYWDRLGWRDPFASPAFTARQNRYAALWHNDGVYTPAFVLDGKEMRNGLALGSDQQVTGVVSAASEDGKSWSISFRPVAGEGGDWDAHLALLGTGISSKIDAGENGGRNLRHDFVVLAQKDAPLQKEAGGLTASLTLPASAESVPRQAVAFWVTRRGELAAVQATGGWLGRSAP